MTFEVKLLITFVVGHPLVILTKFGRNPIKHVEEEANCEKKERRTRHAVLKEHNACWGHFLLDLLPLNP